MPKELELSRRKALAALGTIGAASAGAGLGTSAFFSDQETFENNQLTAGELDMKVSWEEHYSDWSEDEADHAHMEDGELVIDDQQGFMNATLQEEFPDKIPKPSLDAGEVDPCEVLADVPDDISKPVIDIADVKPGDFGEVTFDFVLCDNPGFVWMNGELLENAENSLTEPEIDDPDEDDGPGDMNTSGDLADAIQTTLWYDNNCDNTKRRDTPCLKKKDLNGTQFVEVCTFNIESDPPQCDWLQNIPTYPRLHIKCNGDCPADKKDVWVIKEDEGGCRININLAEDCHKEPLSEVWVWDNDWTDLPCADPKPDGDVNRGDEFCVCPAEVSVDRMADDEWRDDNCEFINDLEQGQDIWLLCEAPDVPRKDIKCREKFCPLSPDESHTARSKDEDEKNPDGVHDLWISHPDNPQVICRLQIKVTDESCRKEPMDDDDEVWDVDRDWNKQNEHEVFTGSLRETMAVLSQDSGIPIDGNPVTPFDNVVDGKPASGMDPNRECFDPETRYCIGFKWELPVDHGNEVQSDSVTFDLGFYTEQCRHNDGSGMNDAAVDDGGAAGN